jgi:hypothetical protein
MRPAGDRRRRDVMNAPAFIPLLFPPGDAYQCD